MRLNPRGCSGFKPELSSSNTSSGFAQRCSRFARSCLGLLGAAQGCICRNNDYTMINNSSASLHNIQKHQPPATFSHPRQPRAKPERLQATSGFNLTILLYRLPSVVTFSKFHITTVIIFHLNRLTKKWKSNYFKVRHVLHSVIYTVSWSEMILYISLTRI